MRLFQRSSPLPHIYPLHQILFYITPSPPSRFRTLSHPPLCHCQPPLENVERTCMDSTHGFNVMPFTTSSGIYSRMAKCLRSPQFSLFLSLHISLFLPGSLFTISILLPPPPPPPFHLRFPLSIFRISSRRYYYVDCGVQWRSVETLS